MELLQDIKSNFMEELNSSSKSNQLTQEPGYFRQIIEKELDRNAALTLLSDAQQEKIQIKTILIDSRLDFVASTKKLQNVFNQEFEKMVNTMNEKYDAELLVLKQLFRKQLVGEGLIKLVNEVSKAGWVLVMKENSVNLYKCYNPEHPVNEGYYENGDIRIYSHDITSLRGIYVNILHPKITYGTIYLATSGGKHPNCGEKYFGAACPGTFADREIPINDTAVLINLLDEITYTYERMHLDSAYYIPNGDYTERKELQWTT